MHTVGKAIVLRGDGGNLELEIASDRQWTHCLLAAEKKVFLGADRLDCVIAGLLRALHDDDDTLPVGKINSTSVRYALHLEGNHHSLYYGDE